MSLGRHPELLLLSAVLMCENTPWTHPMGQVCCGVNNEFE